jgi:hypothetical protein
MEFVLEPTDITRELIIRKVSEENIMENYLGVRVERWEEGGEGKEG